jgi:Mg2+ and Co2+ transporter CorA
MAYIASQEQEEFSQAPRAPYQGWKGTFDSEQHKNLHKDPRAYVEFILPPDWPEQWGPPPMPTRNQYSPNIQAYEMAYERWRRSHQAAIAGNPLPTDAQKINDKSGVALEKIQDAGAVGAFHFTDNFARFLTNAGMQINELITKLAELDSLPKHVLGRNKKDEDVRIQVVGKDFVPPESSERLPEANYFFAHRGQFEVSVGDGPNYKSEREEGSAFADQIWELAAKIGLPPQVTMKLLALATRLKNVGALGDEIAELLSPPDQNKLPPQAQAAIAQLQGQLQQAMQEVQKLRMEKLGKVVEIQGKTALADKEFSARMAEADKDRETKLAVAEITTKAQSMSERVAAVEDLMSQFHDQAHQVSLLMQGHRNAQELANQNAAVESQAVGQQQQHEQSMAQQQPEPAAAQV